MTVEKSEPPATSAAEPVRVSYGFLAIIGLLVVCLASLRNVPIGQPWGVDLQNLHLFHTCARGTSPYLITGPACGDPFGRGMYYPPLLYYSSAWIKLFTLHRAMQIWSVVQLLVYAGVLYLWVRRIAGEKLGVCFPGDCVIFGGLLLVQFPAAFSLERGGSDAWAVALVTVAAWAVVRQRYALSGAALGVATAFKLYPVFACAVIVVGVLIANWSRPLRSRERWRFMSVGATAFAVFALISAAFYSDSKLYFLKVLPAFADTLYMPGTIGHSLSALTWSFPRFGALLMAMLMALWGWSAGRAFLRGDYASGIAGALAISTYSQRTSWDYNLVTTYPLFMVLFLRARTAQRWALLAFGIFAILGERDFYGAPENLLFTPTLHILLQVAFLVMSALVIAVGPPLPPSPSNHWELRLR